jgi:hypothetical protein
MKDNNLDEILQKIAEIKEVGRKNSRRISLLLLLYISIGIALSYLFRMINSQEQYMVVLGLLSQLIAFVGAIMLSEQFLSVPEKYSGIQDHVAAAAISAPFGIWVGSLLYTLFASIFGLPHSEFWAKAVTVILFGVGMMIYGVGSIEEAFSLEIKDKSAVVAIGWYLIVFSLGIQIYISLIELDVIW